MNQEGTLIFQLGTNNWQSADEFAPGSGILHEQHHDTFNDLPGFECHSVFPSKRQRFKRPDVRVFELTHDIPICESVSPVSSYRWHSMSEDEFSAYEERLVAFVTSYIKDIEEKNKKDIDLMIAHHAFLNPRVLGVVNQRRLSQGRKKIPLYAFVHGTSLLMFKHEMEGGNPEYPPRFYPKWKEEKVFEHVDGVFVISNSQKERFLSVFEDFDENKICVAPNGINPKVFKVFPELKRENVLPTFSTEPYEGSNVKSEVLSGEFDRMVLFVGKFADIKRLDTLLEAAKTYEKKCDEAGLSVATVIAGHGPLDEQKLYQDMAITLGLKHAYFVGPHQQPELAKLYNVADVGVFPTKFEAFGLVFLECLACGTPVVGNNAGGPMEFVDETVGALVEDVDSNKEFAQKLGETLSVALLEDWKKSKSKAAIERASGYTLTAQCTKMLEHCEGLINFRAFQRSAQ